MLSHLLGNLKKKLTDRAKSRADASPENARLNRQADRLERTANNPKASRPEAKMRNAEAARSAQRDFITPEGVKGGVVGSNGVSTVSSGVIKMTTDE